MTITSAIVGPVIPPSIPMVMYAVISGASLGALFLGGVIPGLLISLSLSIYCFIVAKKYNFPISPRPSMKELFRAFKFAFFPLMTPVILLAGIYSGAFTPTEAAVVCTLYAIIVAFAMNRDMKLKHLVPIGRNVLLQTGVTMFVIAAINVFRWIIVREHIPEIIANLVVQMNISKPLMLALLNIVLLGLGCLLPITTIMLAFVPILLPILPLLNIDLVHFGGVLTINLMIGLVTPPFGMQLFVIHGLTKIPISQIIQKVWPQLASVGIVLILITYYEPLVLWLPNLMKQVLVFLTFPEYTPN